MANRGPQNRPRSWGGSNEAMRRSSPRAIRAPAGMPGVRDLSPGAGGLVGHPNAHFADLCRSGVLGNGFPMRAQGSEMLSDSRARVAPGGGKCCPTAEAPRRRGAVGQVRMWPLLPPPAPARSHLKCVASHAASLRRAGGTDRGAAVPAGEEARKRGGGEAERRGKRSAGRRVPPHSVNLVRARTNPQNHRQPASISPRRAPIGRARTGTNRCPR